MKTAEKASVTFRINPEYKDQFTKATCKAGISNSKAASLIVKDFLAKPSNEQAAIIEKHNEEKEQIENPLNSVAEADQNEKLSKAIQNDIEKSSFQTQESSYLDVIDELRQKIERIEERDSTLSSSYQENIGIIRDIELNRDKNINHIINRSLEKIEQEAEQKLEEMKKKYEADLEKVKIDTEEKIRSENIVITVHSELKETFEIYYARCLKNGSVKEEKQIIQKFLHSKWNWSSFDVDRELWKKAMNGRSL